LIHFIPNRFNFVLASSIEVKDSVTGAFTKLTKKIVTKGVNYVKNFSPLKICEVGQLYKEATNSCEKYSLSELLTSVESSAVTPTSDQLSIQSQMILNLGASVIGPLANETIIFPNTSSNLNRKNNCFI